MVFALKKTTLVYKIFYYSCCGKGLYVVLVWDFNKYVHVLEKIAIGYTCCISVRSILKKRTIDYVSVINIPHFCLILSTVTVVF